METTAKDFLEQYRSICKELDWIDSEFDRLEKEASQFETDSVVGSSKSEPYQPHSILISDFIPNQTAIKQMDELKIPRKACGRLLMENWGRKGFGASK